MQDIKQCKECGHENPKKFMGKEYTSHAPNCPQDIKQQLREKFVKLSVYLQETYPLQHTIPHPQYNIDIDNFIESVFSLAVEQEKARRDKEWVEKINEITDYDHSKCPIKETCIGYGNCVSDIKNGVIDNLINNK